MNPNQLFGDLVSTTLNDHSAEIVDNVSNHNALFRYIKKNGNYKKSGGGLKLVEPIEYAENETYQRYSGYDLLKIQRSDVFTAVEYAWRQIAISVVSSGLDTLINSGSKESIINLASARIKNARTSFANNFAADMYSDGTLANQIGGLQALVSDSGLGTVGGIDSATWDFWRSQVTSATAPIQGGGPITVTAANIENQFMAPLYLRLIRNNDKPDLIVADYNTYSMFDESQNSKKRYVDSSMADAGFESIKFRGINVVFDGNDGIPANTMYFLNTKYIYLKVHSDRDLKPIDSTRPVNQDATIRPMLWAGNMIVTNRQRQGVAKAV